MAEAVVSGRDMKQSVEADGGRDDESGSNDDRPRGQRAARRPREAAPASA